jgi:hypothetical protein
MELTFSDMEGSYEYSQLVSADNQQYVALLHGVGFGPTLLSKIISVMKYDYTAAWY